MGKLQGALIWLAGHQPSNLENDDPQDCLGIAKLGSAVLFAAVIAAASWATAAYVAAEAAYLATRWCIAGTAGLFGCALVLVLDRIFLYLSDTVSFSKNASVAFYIVRMAMVGVTSSITGGVLMPWLLRDEMNAEALLMTEAGERTRQADLSKQFDVGGKSNALAAAHGDVQVAASDLHDTPAEVARLESQAKRCFSQYSQAAKAAQSARAAHADAAEAAELDIAEQQRLAQMQRECRRLDRASQVARAEHMALARERLTLASQRALQAGDALNGAQTTVGQRVEAARAVEAEAFTPNSAKVLWHLLRNDPASFIKWLLATLLVFLLETLPLWLKGLAGRSVPGERICAEAAQRRRKIQARAEQAELDHEASRQINACTHEAVQLAMQSPQTQALFRAAIAQHFAPLAPIQAVSALMTQLSQRQEDVDDFVRQHPRYASLVAQAWSTAIQSAVKAVREAAEQHQPAVGAI